MTTQDMMTIITTIIGVNIAFFGALATMIYWLVSRIDTDVRSLSSRLDGHAMRIDQLYRMFVELLKERK